MAKIDIARMKVGIDVEVNHQTLSDLKKQLAQIRVDIQSKNRNGMTESLEETLKVANQLDNIITKSWNSRLNQFDLSKLNNDLKKSNLTATSLKQTFSAYPEVYNNFSRKILESNVQLKQSSKLLDQMSVTMANTVRFGISSSIINNLTNSISKAYNYTLQLDKSLNDIRIVSNESAANMERFAKQANTAAKELGASTLDYTKAALIYYQQGLPSDQIEERSNITVKMANVLGRSAEEVSDYMTAIWNNFADGSQSLEYYADVITKLGAATASSAEEIAGGLEKFAAVGQTIGLSYEYATAALTTITAQTRQSEDVVGTALKTIFSRIQGLSLGDTLDDGTTLNKYSEALSKVGIKIKDQNNELKDMDTILNEMGEKWGTLNKDQQVALAQTVAGVRQYNQLVALMDNWDFMKENLETAANATGELDAQQAIYMDSVEAHLQQLKATAEETYNTLFDTDAIKTFADMATGALEALNDLLTGLGGGINAITTIGLDATNLFSNQMAGGIQRSLENKRKSSQNSDELKQEIINNHEMQGQTDLDSTAMDREVEVAKKILSIKKNLTEEEAQQLISQQQKIGLLTDDINRYTKIDKELGDIAKKYGLMDDTADSFNSELEDTKAELKKIKNLIKSLEGENANIYEEETLDLLKQHGIQLKENEKTNEGYTTKLTTLQGDLVNKQKELTQAAKERTALDEQDIDVTIAQRDALESNVDSVVRQKQEQENIQTVIKGTTAILSMASSLGGIFSTAFNEDMSTWDKFKSINAVILTQLPFMLANMDSIAKLLPALTTLLGAETAVQEALNAAKQKENMVDAEGNVLKGKEIIIRLKAIAAKIAETIATWAHNVALAVQKLLTGDITALGIAAVTAMVAMTVALTALVIKMVKANSEEAKLKKRVEETSEAVKEATDAYNELKESVSSYKNARSDIDNLKEGTVEFYEAVMKSNEEAQKLIDTLNLMPKDMMGNGQYSIDKNGLISIDEDVLQRELFKKQQEIYRNQGQNLQARRDLEEYNQKQIIKQFRNEVNQEARRQGSGATISYDQAQNILANQGKFNDTLIQNNKLFSSFKPDLNGVLEKNNQQLNSFQNLTEQKIGEVKTSVDNSSINIQKAIDNNLGKYNQSKAKIDSLETQRVIATLRGYGTEEQVENFDSYSERSQKAIAEMVKQENAANTHNENVKDMGFGDYAKTYGKNMLKWFWTGPVAPIAASWNTAADAGTNDGKKEGIKELYAQYALGYKKEANGQWFNEYGNAVDNDEMKEILKEIKTNTAVQAYNNGDFATAQSLQNAQDSADNIRKNVNSWGFDTSSSQYMTDAMLGLKTGTFDKELTKLLTNEEKEKIKSAVKPETTEPTKSFSFSVNDPFSMSTQYSQEEIDKFLEASDEVGRSIERIKADLKEYNSTLESNAAELGTTAEALEFYGQAMYNASKETNKMDKASAEAIADQYKFNKKYNEAVATYYDNEDAIKAYGKALKNNEQIAYDVADAMGELSKSLKEMGLSLSAEQISDNLDTVKKLLTGTKEEAEQAYQTLLKLSQINTMNTIFGPEAKDQLDKYTYSYQQLIDAINTTDPGTNLSQQYAASLSKMIQDTHLTMDEINKLGEGLNITIPVKYKVPKKMTFKEQKFTTKAQSVLHKYTGEMPNPGYDKKKDPRLKIPVNYSWIETTEEKTNSFLVPDETGITVNQSTKSLGGGASRNYTPTIANQKAAKDSGGSKSEPSKKDLNEDKVDRYEKVNVQLQLIENQLKKIQNQEKKLIGQKLIDNLNKQLNILNKQIDKTNEKMKIARGQQSELQRELSSYGIGFDVDGVMTNYAQVFAAQQNALNSVYRQYNSMSAEAQKKFEETVKAAEKKWNRFKEAVSEYDQLIGSTIPGLEDTIEEASNKKLEIKIKEFDMEIELALDIKSAQDKWNDFRKSIIKDLKEDDILGNALDNLERFSDYYNQTGDGVLQKETNYLQNLMKQIDQYNTTGWSDWYGNDEVAMMDDLRKYYEQAFDDLQNVKELVDEIHKALNATLEDVAERMEEQMNYYETISDTLEHDMKMVELVYGDEAFGKLELYYTEQEKNYNNQLEFQRAQVDFWKQQMDALDKGSTEWETARDNWLDAVSEWQSMVESAIENLTDKYLNTINKIFQELNNQVTKGAGMDFINTEWELIQKHADEYLDTINSTYGIQQLQNKYLDAMNDTDNLTYQKKLNELMKAEVADLKARDRLTQYDLDRAELKYQIALKQIALQEAQQNKSTMRLKRDNQGNYSYQYVSDDDQVQKAQEELAILYNQLYNLDVDRYTGNLDQLYEIWMEYQEKMAEAAMINDPEKRLQKEQLLTQQYGDLINGIVDQNEQLKRNLYESTFLELEDLYGKQSEIVQDFLDNQDDAMSLLVSGWASGLQEMADQIYAEGGFEPTYEQALADITEATANYEESLKQLQDSAKVTFETLGEDVDEVETEVQQLINKTDELVSTFGNEVEQIKSVIGQIDELNNHYQKQTNVINTAIDAYNKYIQKMREAEQAANKNTSSNGGSGQSTGGSSGNGSSGGGGGAGNANKTPSVGQWVTYNGGYYYGDSYGGGGRGSRGPGKRVKVTIVKNDGRPYPIHVESSDSAFGWLRKDQLSGYDTGGYTGSWGSTEGRVALLHEKELVLNKEDTKNLLDTVEIMRNLTNSLGSSILKQMASMSRTGVNGMVGGEVLEQEVHIDAQFPNVRDSREIENALNNLVNAAAQRANKR